MPRDTFWSDQNIQTLTEMWGMRKISAIAKMMGVTKNAIIGKARRLGLRHEPEPVETVKVVPIVPARALSYGATTLPKLPSMAVAPRPIATIVAPRRVAPAAAPHPVVFTLAAPMRFSPERACCWPIGDPLDRANFRFCGDPIGGRQSYCEVHHRMAHSRPMRLADLAADTGRPANSSHILDSL